MMSKKTIVAIPQQSDYLVVGNDLNTIPSSLSLHAPPTTGKIIVLNGFPGTGKLTILKQAKELLPADTTILMDNHLLIDPVTAVIPDRSDEHHELRRKLRAPVFKKLGERAQEGYVILMTACLAENNVRDTASLKEHLDMVRGTNVPIIWVNVHCGQTALEQRLRSPERCQGAKTKLTDVRVLRDLLREQRLIEPSKSADRSANLVVETLDVSGPVELSVSRLMIAIGFPQSIVSTR
jgi:chloramphenicol 3-O-phosphotransferase